MIEIPESLLQCKTLIDFENWFMERNLTSPATSMDEVRAWNKLKTEDYLRENLSPDLFAQWQRCL